MDFNIDYYEILGVSHDASVDEIKKVYHKLLRIYHPDNNPTDQDHIKLVNKAYEVLSNEEKRKQYDLKIQNVKEDDFVNPNDLSEMFKNNMKEKAKRQVLKDILDKEIQHINELLERKNQFILDAILDKYEQKEYYQMTKKIILEFEQEAKKFNELKLKLNDEYYFSEVERVDGVLFFISEALKELSPDLEDLKINYEKLQLEKKYSYLLHQKCGSIDDAIYEMCKFAEQIYLGEISRTEYKKIYDILSLALNDEIKGCEVLLEIEKQYGTLDQDRNLIQFISNIITHVPKHIFKLDYDHLCKLGKSIHSYHLDKMNYEEWMNIKDKKIDKIMRIIDRYPNNKKSRFLFEYGESLLKEQLDYYEQKYRCYTGDYTFGFRDLYNFVPCLSTDSIKQLRYNLKDKYEQYILEYESIPSLKKKTLPEDKKDYGICGTGKQLIYFKNMKTYGDFVSRYQFWKYFLNISSGSFALYVLNMIREYNIEHVEHLAVELLLSLPIFGFLFINNPLLNHWLKDMKKEIEKDPYTKKILHKTK